MQIIEALGINHTIFMQFGIFIFAFIVLNFGLFKPYSAAMEMREKNTVGNNEAAIGMLADAQKLRSNFEIKARDINASIKNIFDTYRAEAHAEVERILGQSKAASQEVLDKTRMRVNKEVAEASEQIQKEIPSLVQAIVSKALSKKV